jgi:hypothetical protein
MTAVGRHGTLSGYTHGGCRQACCRAANAAYQRLRNSQRRQLLANGIDVKHGSASTYANYGCRCQPCKDASAQYWQTYSQTPPGSVERTPAPDPGGPTPPT